jgi:hypothetical protein
MKIGIGVECSICGQTKKPRGRSAPIGLYMCDMECEGYYLDPKVGDLWPGETQEEFGYPVSANGTRDVVPNSVDEVEID